jgi:AcrR family transcriptional regulator
MLIVNEKLNKLGLNKSDMSIFDSMKVDGQESRKRIIREAAKSLFQSGSIGTISMRDIAAKAGMAVRSIYRYFSSRDMIYLELFKADMKALEIKINRELKAGPTTVEEISFKIIDFFMDNHSCYEIFCYFMTNVQIDESISKEFNTVKKSFIKVLEAVFERTKLNNHSEISAKALFCYIIGMLLDHIKSPDIDDGKKRAQMYHLVLSPIMPGMNKLRQRAIWGE